jgi:hypothetical protein
VSDQTDQEWANQSLRRALQDIQDAATKPLHVELDRLRRELAEVRALLREWRDKRAWDARDGAHWVRLFQDDVDALDAFLTPAAPAEKPQCTCDDHEARYCVNRISRTIRCGCECHR